MKKNTLLKRARNCVPAAQDMTVYYVMTMDEYRTKKMKHGDWLWLSKYSVEGTQTGKTPIMVSREKSAPQHEWMCMFLEDCDVI